VCVQGFASADQELRVCISEGSASDCQQALRDAYPNYSAGFTCNKRDTDTDCLESIRNNEDDVTIVGGEEKGEPDRQGPAALLFSLVNEAVPDLWAV